MVVVNGDTVEKSTRLFSQDRDVKLLVSTECRLIRSHQLRRSLGQLVVEWKLNPNPVYYRKPQTVKHGNDELNRE